MKIEAAYLACPVAAKLFDEFNENGHQLWYVGGCVRNAILDRPVEDIDLSTDATPQEMRRIAENANMKIIPTGEAHGTMTVVLDSVPFEITTFRKDVETDGRRAVVSFSTDISEDAVRRDFTMNALYMDKIGNLSDPIGGYNDAVQRRIKFIRDPQMRIREDYLRILRFFRFYAWYGATSEGIDESGLAACAENAEGLSKISRERIGAEMIKILSAPNPSTALAAMEKAGVLRVILPGATAKFIPILVDFEKDAITDPLHRLAAMAADVPKDALRLSKAELKRLDALIDISRNTDNPFAMGHILGLEDGLAAYRIRCALLEQFPNQSDVEKVHRGAKMKFPLRASHINKIFSGPALGEALEVAKAHWLVNFGRPTKNELVCIVRGES